MRVPPCFTDLTMSINGLKRDTPGCKLNIRASCVVNSCPSAGIVLPMVQGYGILSSLLRANDDLQLTAYLGDEDSYELLGPDDTPEPLYMRVGPQAPRRELLCIGNVKIYTENKEKEEQVIRDVSLMTPCLPRKCRPIVTSSALLPGVDAADLELSIDATDETHLLLSPWSKLSTKDFSRIVPVFGEHGYNESDMPMLYEGKQAGMYLRRSLASVWARHRDRGP